MPYLNSKIKNHNEECKKPSAKRIYVRDYDDKGRQKFVSYGVTCPSCGVIQREEYQKNLTAIALKKKGKYTLEQEQKFVSIDNEFLFSFIKAGENNKSKKFAVQEYVKKLKEAGMTHESAVYRINKIFNHKR